MELKEIMDKHYPPFESLQLINTIKAEERQLIKEELLKVVDNPIKLIEAIKSLWKNEKINFYNKACN